MTNIFQQAISDIFKCDDFLEEVIIDGNSYKCIASKVENSMTFGEAGLVEDVDFTLSLKLPLSLMPKVGEKLKFRNVDYRISRISPDSANSSITLSLSDLSKG